MQSGRTGIDRSTVKEMLWEESALADKVTGADIEELSLKELREIVRKLQELLSEEQKQKFQEIVRECRENDEKEDLQPVPARMSQELIEEKLEQIRI